MFARTFCVVFTLALGGCAFSGGYPQSPVNVNTDLDPLKVYFGPQVFTEYANALDEATRMAFRNEVIFGRIAAYDAEFSQFQIDINREQSLTDATGDSIVAVAAAAGTGFSAKATKTAMNGISGAVTGIKGAVDKDIFFSQAMGSLYSYMDTNRKSILADIVTGTAQSTTAYPLTKGIADTMKYRDAGSIPNALAAVAEQTKQPQKDATQKLTSANFTAMQVRERSTAALSNSA
jgi:hypothetical protein